MGCALTPILATAAVAVIIKRLLGKGYAEKITSTALYYIQNLFRL